MLKGAKELAAGPSNQETMQPQQLSVTAQSTQPRNFGAVLKAGIKTPAVNVKGRMLSNLGYPGPRAPCEPVGPSLASGSSSVVPPGSHWAPGEPAGPVPPGRSLKIVNMRRLGKSLLGKPGSNRGPSRQTSLMMSV